MAKKKNGGKWRNGKGGKKEETGRKERVKGSAVVMIKE